MAEAQLSDALHRKLPDFFAFSFKYAIFFSLNDMFCSPRNYLMD